MTQCKGVGLTSLLQWENLWYKGEKCDNKEWDVNYKYPFLGFHDIRESDIMEVDIMEFRV